MYVHKAQVWQLHTKPLDLKKPIKGVNVSNYIGYQLIKHNNECKGGDSVSVCMF